MIVKNNKILQHKVPEKLNWVIEMVNGLPLSAKSWDEMQEAAKELEGTPLKNFDRKVHIFGMYDPDRPSTALEVAIMIFMDNVEELQDQAREYVGHLYPETAVTLVFEDPYPYASGGTMAAALVRYNLLINVRKILEEIARLNESSYRDRDEDYEQARATRSNRDKFIADRWVPRGVLSTTLSGSNMFFCINDQGKIAFTLDKLLDGILGADAERIRKCPICNRIFWAGRIDKKGCSNQCANSIRVHRSRKLAKQRSEQYRRARIKRQKNKIGSNP